MMRWRKRLAYFSERSTSATGHPWRPATRPRAIRSSAATFRWVVRGYQQKQASRQLQNFPTASASEEVSPFDQAAAELAGRIAGELERIGQPIGLADPMIAAIALTHGLELVTGNTAH